MTAPGVSRRIASFIADADPRAMPAATLHQAKRSLLNFFAVALAGCRDPTTETALRVLAPFAGAGPAGLIGRAETFDPLTAAFLNALSANVFDFDDTHPGTVIHPTAPVAPALFALAQTRRISGAAFLHALILGMEIECRIGNAVSPGHYARGWHITSTCGVFGAAMAAGKCLGLSAEQLLWALGNASAQSCGLVETLGTSAKSLSVGNAARNGLLSALAAQHGFDGPEKPLEGIRGFLNVLGQDANPAAITDGLGTRWEAARNTYKPYPCGIVLHAVLDACLLLRGTPGFAHTAVQEIVVRGHPLLAQRTDRPDVTTGRESQVSAQHAVAVALLTGRAGLAEFADAAVGDPATRAFRTKVRMEDDPALSIEAAEVVIRLEDGTVLRQHVAQAHGGEHDPLSDAELEAKLRSLAPDYATGLLIEAVWELDRRENAGELVGLVGN